MSRSQYWTSLWVAGLVILLCLFCLFLGVEVFVFLYDRISTFEVWNSPIWLKLKIPVIAIGVIGFLAAAIALNRYQGQMELKAAQSYAQAQGWGFSRDAAAGFEAAVAEILSNRKFHMYHIRTVETGRCKLYLFDCSYNNRDASARSRSDSHGTACLVQSDRFRAAIVPVEISTRDWTEVMQSDKVEMGETPFARNFLVQSRDPGSAKRIVNESLQAILLEHTQKPLFNPVGVTIGPGGAVVMTGRTAEPERLRDLLDLARKLESALN